LYFSLGGQDFLSFGGLRNSEVSAGLLLDILSTHLSLAGIGALQTSTLGQIAKRGSWRGKCCQLVSYPHLFSKFLSSICAHTNTPSVEGNEVILHLGGWRECAEPRS
jgi:hypothetical protein